MSGIERRGAVEGPRANNAVAGRLPLIELLEPRRLLSSANLVATLATENLPTSVVAGTRSHANVRVVIANNGAAAAAGSIVINLFASADQSIAPDSPLLVRTTRAISLKPGKNLTVSLPRFTWPAAVNGNFSLVADVNATHSVVESDYTDGVAVGPAAVRIAPPFVDLDNLFTTAPMLVVHLISSVSVPLKNIGNVTARGAVMLTLDILSPFAPPGTTPIELRSLRLPLSLAAGRTRRLSISFPVAYSGEFRFIITASLPRDVDAANDTATSTNASGFVPSGLPISGGIY
jgi:hypothetical protein